MKIAGDFETIIDRTNVWGWTVLFVCELSNVYRLLAIIRLIKQFLWQQLSSRYACDVIYTDVATPQFFQVFEVSWSGIRVSYRLFRIFGYDSSRWMLELLNSQASKLKTVQKSVIRRTISCPCIKGVRTCDISRHFTLTSLDQYGYTEGMKLLTSMIM